MESNKDKNEHLKGKIDVIASKIDNISEHHENTIHSTAIFDKFVYCQCTAFEKKSSPRMTRSNQDSS